MNIRQLAEQDLAHVLEDAQSGFGWNVTLIAPDGRTTQLNGQLNDVGVMIDPDTGAQVSGRTVSLTLRLSSISKAGFDIPEGIPERNSVPWTVEAEDVTGARTKFKVEDTSTDRVLGIVDLMLGEIA